MSTMASWRSSKVFVLIVVFLAAFIDILCYSIIIPFIPFIVASFGGDPKDTGLLLAVYAVGVLLPSPIFGIWSDKFQNRKLPMLLGLAGLLLSTIFFAFANQYWMLAVARFLQGVSSAATWTLGLTLLADKFKQEELGKAMSVVLMGYTLAQTVGPPVGGILYENFGYFSPFILCGAFTVLDFVGRMLIVDGNKVPSDVAINDEHGTEEVNVDKPEVNENVTQPLNTDTTPEEHSPQTTEKKVELGPSFLKVAKIPELILLGVTTIISGSALTAIEPTLPLLLASEYKLNVQAIGLIFLAIVIPTIIFSPIVGSLYDKFGFSKIVIPGILLTIICTPVMIILQREVWLGWVIILLFLFSLAIGLIMVPLMPEMSLWVPKEAYGKVYGLFNMFFSGGMMLGPTVLGAIPYQYLGWMWMIIIITISFVPLLPFLWFYKRPTSKE